MRKKNARVLLGREGAVDGGKLVGQMRGFTRKRTISRESEEVDRGDQIKAGLFRRLQRKS